jgi:tRNA pseudouridine55 synthase
VSRRRKGNVVDGWLVLDKPAGLTSTDAVTRLKRRYHAQKVGHAGTLDPLATGVLPIAFGQATKTVAHVQDATKEYRFTLAFGEARDTDDAEGKVVATSDARPADAAITEAVQNFIGDIMQVPPAFSAIKVAGERAYDLAREGNPPDLPARPARVDRFVLLARPDADTAEFAVTSGKGVYRRSLARDLAKAVGSLGHIRTLRRLRVGPFTEAMAVPLDSPSLNDHNPPAQTPLLAVETALADIPAMALTVEEASPLHSGQAISLIPLLGRIPAAADPDGGFVRAVAGGRVIALGRLQDGMLHPVRLLVSGPAPASP